MIERHRGRGVASRERVLELGLRENILPLG
jgi:hypothetical protein